MSAIQRWWGSKPFPGIPLGGIIGLDPGYGISGNYAFYANAADNTLILGGTTAGGTGGSTYIGQVWSDGGDSNHWSNDGAILGRKPSGTGSVTATVAAGSHAHLTAAYHMPKQARVRLIQATQANTPVPPGGILLGDVASLTSLDANSFLNDTGSLLGVATAGTAVEAAAYGVGVDAASFSHRHHSDMGGGTVDGAWLNTVALNYSQPSGGPAHSHDVSNYSFSYDAKRAILKAFVRVSAHPDIAKRTIIMFEGATIPKGWKLCDGTNGTIDLVDYWVALATTSLGVHAGNNAVSGSYYLVPAGTHNHWIGTTTETHLGYYYSHNGNISHAHWVNLPATGWRAPFRMFKFIQYMG